MSESQSSSTLVARKGPYRPEPDHYDDGSTWVLPHFSPIPPLTAIPMDHHYWYLVEPIRRKLVILYNRHRLDRCRHAGLYYEGCARVNNEPDRDKVIILVLELTEPDLCRWREFDGEVQHLLRKYIRTTMHGVCVRYYAYQVDGGTRAKDTHVPSAISPPCPPSTELDEDEIYDVEDLNTLGWSHRRQTSHPTLPFDHSSIPPRRSGAPTIWSDPAAVLTGQPLDPSIGRREFRTSMVAATRTAEEARQRMREAGRGIQRWQRATSPEQLPEVDSLAEQGRLRPAPRSSPRRSVEELFWGGEDLAHGHPIDVGVGEVYDVTLAELESRGLV